MLKGAIVFTLQSIKSRIETHSKVSARHDQAVFLLYSPLNQGLKHSPNCQEKDTRFCFYSTVH